MLQFGCQLRDIFVTTGSILIMPIDMRTLGYREQALLERNFQIISATVTMSEGAIAESLLRNKAGENFRT